MCFVYLFSIVKCVMDGGLVLRCRNAVFFISLLVWAVNRTEVYMIFCMCSVHVLISYKQHIIINNSSSGQKSRVFLHDIYKGYRK